MDEPPTAVDDTFAATENGSNIVFNVLTDDGVDTDTEGDSLSVSSYTESIAALTCTTGSTPSCTFNPSSYDSLDTDEPGSEVFTYVVSDGDQTDTGTVTINITGVNDAPVANPDTISVDIAGTATTLSGGGSSVLANDTDPDANEAVKDAVLDTGPSFASSFVLNSDGTFTYTHDGSDNLADSFTYHVNDFDADSNITTVSITIANTAPTAVDDPLVASVLEGGSVNFNVLGNDTDPETSATNVVNITNQIGGIATVEANQTVTFNHDGSEIALASFRYQANDGFLTSAGTALVTIAVTLVNDPPVLGAISNQNGTEGVLVSIDAGAVLSDPDDNNNGTDITWSVDSAIVGDMAIDNMGVFNWTPALGTQPPPADFGATYPVTISASDGEFSDSVSFTLTIDPPDADSDGVADYNDYCPGPPAQASVDSADGSNADNDGDGTRGSDADPDDNVGGDVCDADDDNDGMPDSFELANSLDPFDAADADLDADGDGVSNLEEYLAGTNPNLVNLVIDATGYLTPYELTPPEPKTIHTQATVVTASDYGPYRPGDNIITWTPSNGSSADLAASDPNNLVSDPPVQPFDIRPLASIASDQQVEENSAATVTVTVRLNGDAPSWTDTPAPNPATVRYTVSGTATNPDDHNALAGVLTFNDGEYEQDITFNVFTDGITDPDETIVITLTGASNATLGSKNTHTVTIVEENIAPRAFLQFSQGGSAVGSTFEGSAITVDAVPSDANSAQTLSCDWSGTANILTPPGIVADCKSSPSWVIAAPVAGNYLVDVVVTDNGSPVKSARVSRILHVSVAGAVVLDAAVDSDRDGNDDLTEGFADPDGDGIPAYLDAIEDIANRNLIPDQTRAVDDSMLLETEPGLTLRRGSTTQAADIFGALVSDSEIEQFGSSVGDAPVNAEDDFDHVSGIYDFEIHGLIPGASARIVIPLQSAVPRDGYLRKYNPAFGWSDFVVDDYNQIASAAGETGACPEPGSSDYQSGLLYLNNCLQLTIQDGGPNDTDNLVNGIVNDPSGVGLQLTEPEVEKVEEGSGRVSPLLLATLLVLCGLVYWRRRRGMRID